ncbi:MAG: hypothetical protein PHD97_00820 [Bacteroidales bacterium]|nr:hypothetical protein [Bacteroidales bacterium]
MQESGKIAIFTQYHMNPKHPRIEMEYDVLKKNGFNAEIIHPTSKVKSRSLLYLLTFAYFNWKLIFEYKKIINDYKKVIIYDFALLPLAFFVNNRNTQVIYETIDHNILFGYYELTKRLKLLKLFRWFIIPVFSFIEKTIIKNKIDKIIVNSDSLKESFSNLDKEIIVNYYASPFENNILQKTSSNNFALLYFGRINNFKGYDLMAEFSKKYNIKLFLFGDVDDEDTMRDIKENQLISYVKKISIKELSEKIVELSKNYKLLGISLVKDENESSAIQELNKDIDYLALGIPIIGNYRIPTKEKIEKNCGLFYDDDEKIKKLLTCDNFYDKLSSNCKTYYNSRYSMNFFEEKIIFALT